MKLLKKWMALLLVGLYLSACGGGGGSNPGTQQTGGETPQTGGVGIAVDPYIVGAVFNEVQVVAGVETVQQTSTPSDEKGRFTFASPFTLGSFIVMTTTKGMHNGAPFEGTLKREVDGSGELVASPLTTLLAEGLDEDQVVELIAADASAEEKAELKSKLKNNPMESIESGDDRLLIAAIAVNVALRVLEDNVASANLGDIIAAVIEVLETKVFNQENDDKDLDDRIGTAVALSDYVADEIDETEDSNAVKGIVTTGLVNAVFVGAAQNGGQVVIEADENGLPVAAAPATSVEALLEKGFAAFDRASSAKPMANTTDDLLDAVKYFSAAAVQVPYDSAATQNDKDTAYFFGAVAQILSLADPYSDAVDNGRNNLGDILDAFGFSADRENSDLIVYPETCIEVDTGSWIYTDCQADPLPLTTPTTGELQQFLFSKLGTELGGAVAALGKVSSGFAKSWSDPVDQVATEFDYADALFLKSIAQAMLGQLNIQQAYDLDVDIYGEEQASDTAKANNQSRTAEDFLAEHPTLGTLKDATKVAAAQGYLSAAADSLLAAMASMESEQDAGVEQINDFINYYDEVCTYSPESGFSCVYDAEGTQVMIASAKSDIAQFKTALSGSTTFDQGTADNADDLTLNFGRFFAGVDLRALVPDFQGDVPGDFPDATLGGIIETGFDLNQDLDDDKSPDLLNGITQFSDALVSDRIFQVNSSCGEYGQLDLAAEMFSYSWVGHSTGWEQITGSGDWNVANGVLELNSEGGFFMSAQIHDGTEAFGEIDLHIIFENVLNNACHGSMVAN